MKLKVFTAMILVLSRTSFGSCIEPYEKKVAELSAQMNPPRTTVLVNIGAEAALVTALLSTGTLTLGAAISLPAAAVGAGSLFAILAAKRSTYRNALMALKQAEDGDGPLFKKIVRKVRKNRGDLSEDEIRQALLRLDSENSFCKEHPRTGKIRLATMKRMVSLVVSEL